MGVRGLEVGNAGVIGDLPAIGEGSDGRGDDGVGDAGNRAGLIDETAVA